MSFGGLAAENWISLLGDFLDESSQLIERLNEDLLTLERRLGECGADCDEELLNRMFRSVHSIKGLSAMLGLANVNRLTHNLEHVLDAARRRELQLAPGALQTMFQAVDHLSAMLDRLKTTGADEIPDDGTFAAIESLLANPVAIEAPRAKDDHSLAVSRPSPPEAESPPETRRPAETMRVDLDRLDQLMNLSGQLAINRARFAQIAGDLRRQARRDSEARERVDRLLEAVHQLDRIATGLQKGVMDARMAPIGPLFQSFQRAVRDMTRGSGKEVRLDIGGELTELDKRMIDALGEPLIHLVRNSVDHGIETQAERIAIGKPGDGVLRLDARHEGNSIVIEVRDDGRGLDPGKILQKAVERGLVDPSAAASLDEPQILDLIWRPGFSTADAVTPISGRGMGMDIVRARVEELHGKIETESRPGMGTKFAIRLPLTLAILPSLLVEIEREVYAIPIESVVEVVEVEKHHLDAVYGSPAVRVRGRTIGVRRLGQLLQDCGGKSKRGSPPPGRGQPRDHGDRTLVIVGAAGCEIGIPVDSLRGEQEIVIKSLAENYQHVPGICGASILGDGSVSLILDPTALVNAAAGRG
jgi:two-component system chemotaxis sensor kinase CheA